MIKNITNLKKADNERCFEIAKTAITKDIPYVDAEKLHDNNIRAYAINELAKSLGISFKDAEKYHDQMVKMTKDLMKQDKEERELLIAETQEDYEV